MTLSIHRKLEKGEVVRVAALGSSNTQRRITGMHWFDYVELGFKKQNKACGQFINSGVGGNTVLDLLERYDKEIGVYKPDLAIITIGGNDSNPVQNINADVFRDNLQLLHKKLTNSACEVILQTYYACDLERIESYYGYPSKDNGPSFAENLISYMQIIRDTGKKLNCPVVDHFSKWEKLRLHDVSAYRNLMNDPMHVNALGNMVLGLDLMDFFKLELNEECRNYCQTGLLVKSYLNSL